ncbi:MAG TPA: NERD domain-containing protein, partial [Bacillales bacterium]|nr:NERD domain-containing protein [Bacillales bacterium]
MIKKVRQESLKIRKLTALVRRLPPPHPKRPLIEKELAKYKAGYHGEQAIDFPL